MDKKRLDEVKVVIVIVSFLLVMSSSFFDDKTGFTGMSVGIMEAPTVSPLEFWNLTPHILQINISANLSSSQLNCSLHYNGTYINGVVNMTRTDGNNFTANLTNATNNFAVEEIVTLVANCTDDAEYTETGYVDNIIPNDVVSINAVVIDPDVDPRSNASEYYWYINITENESFGLAMSDALVTNRDSDTLSYTVLRNSSVVLSCGPGLCSYSRAPVDYNDVGNWIFEFFVNDTWSGHNATIYITVHGGPPAWSNNVTFFDSGENYTAGQEYQFNITWIDEGNHLQNVWLQHNLTGTMQNYTVDFNNSGEFNYTYGELAAGTYAWRSYANDTPGFTVASPMWLFDVQKLDSACSLVLSHDSPQNVSTPINISCDCNNPEATEKLYQNGTGEIANHENWTLTAGAYIFTCNVTESQNYTSATNSTQMQIDKLPSQVSLYLNGTSAGVEVNITAAVNITAVLDKGEADVMLYFNDTLMGSDASLVINVSQYNETGNFNVSAIYPEDANYTQSSMMLWLNVTDPTPPEEPTSTGGGGGGRCNSRWECGSWSECVNGTRNQTCVDRNRCRSDEITVETCDMPKPVVQEDDEEKESDRRGHGCMTNYTCGPWSECFENGTQIMVCTDLADIYPQMYCHIIDFEAVKIRECEPPARPRVYHPAPVCKIPWLVIIALALISSMFIRLTEKYPGPLPDKKKETRIRETKLILFLMISMLVLYLFFHICVDYLWFKTLLILLMMYCVFRNIHTKPYARKDSGKVPTGENLKMQKPKTVKKTVVKKKAKKATKKKKKA